MWRHGGIAFAPKPRDYRISVPKKVRRLAMKSALSCKVSDAELVVVDKIELAEAKTIDEKHADKALELLRDRLTEVSFGK